jgi:tRNA-dihydrouridine synthase B
MKFHPQPFLIFAPMATVSHAGFRHLVEDWGGCSLYFTEMIDASTHLAGRRYETYYADAAPCPDRVVFQVVGADEDDLVAAAASLAAQDCAGIDINMGCSAPNIFRHGAGISWMTDPAKAARLTERLRKAVGTKSLSMKLRLGETEDEASLTAFGRALQNAGADFLTLHPRIRRDSLSRPSRWEWVTLLRDALSIPVVGNGDLDRFRTLESRVAKTPADGWMLGRRAVTAPWTFRYWAGRWADPSFDLDLDLQAVCYRFHELLEAHQPPEFWVTRSRRFYSYFAQNLKFGHAWGARIQNFREYSALLAEVRRFWDERPEGQLCRASELES